nr:MAG TPA: hypothetical protein [Caudoviricetes sp.]
MCNHYACIVFYSKLIELLKERNVLRLKNIFKAK